MPRTLAPVFAVAPLQQLPLLVRKLRELRKCPLGISRQWNTKRRECLLVAGLKTREPAEGIDDLRVDLIDVVSQFTEWRLARPRIEEAAIDAVRVARETAGEQIGLEPANDAHQEVRQDDWRATEAFYGEA